MEIKLSHAVMVQCKWMNTDVYKGDKNLKMSSDFGPIFKNIIEFFLKIARNWKLVIFCHIYK